MTTTNDQTSARRRRNRRPALPQLAEVESLINNTRALRLALFPFTTNDTTSKVAKEAALKLQEVSTKLEQLAELTAALGSRRRSRATTNKLWNPLFPPTSQNRFDVGYDCELPPEVRAELGQPRRARILGRSVQFGRSQTPANPLRTRRPGARRLHNCLSPVFPPSSPLAEKQSTPSAQGQQRATSWPTPVAAATPIASWQSYLGAQQTRATRAALVQPPPPKAQLVRLPECRPGETRPVMPYNLF
jgi:hypothetical protein